MGASLMATYDTWGGSWATSWGLSWTRTSGTVVVDTHDDVERRRRHTESEKKREAEYREARTALHAQVTEAYEIATGERAPETVEPAAMEKLAGQMPKAERPAYRRTILQIRNWQAEIEEIDRILLRLDEQDLDDLSMLL